MNFGPSKLMACLMWDQWPQRIPSTSSLTANRYFWFVRIHGCGAIISRHNNASCAAREKRGAYAFLRSRDMGRLLFSGRYRG